ncbi:hypothetical protein CRE_24853 [Caenorhabditis remanei]|uniref:Uncharacterized protein n=1 Tax=Caenorhabditis remanei TaxID=31234 RepID=E3NKX7_CAERE|nr:hypothetical protein CRE_24853 [Caenorhabditis remanei]
MFTSLSAFRQNSFFRLPPSAFRQFFKIPPSVCRFPPKKCLLRFPPSAKIVSSAFRFPLSANFLKFRLLFAVFRPKNVYFAFRLPPK